MIGRDIGLDQPDKVASRRTLERRCRNPVGEQRFAPTLCQPHGARLGVGDEVQHHRLVIAHEADSFNSLGRPGEEMIDHLRRRRAAIDEIAQKHQEGGLAPVGTTSCRP